MQIRSIIVISAALAAGANAATVTFGFVDFGDVIQLSTTGGLVDAAHFGNDSEADVTANGITFVSRGATSPNLSVGTGANGLSYAAVNLYQPGLHKVGFTDIAGMSAGDEDLMFESVVYGPGVGNSVVTLSGLVSGHDYLFQILNVDDQTAGGNHYSSNDPDGGVFIGPYDIGQNAVQLVTGTFTADAATQTFRDYVGGNNNAQFSAYQLRDLSIPEPSGAALFGLAGLGLFLRRRR